jgi:hypothetical protein
MPLKMTKKELLVLILTKLLPYWDLAQGFLILAQESEDSKFIEELYLLISQQISSIQDDLKKQEVILQIQKIKKTKNQQEEITEQEKNEADTMLDDFINDIV